MVGIRSPRLSIERKKSVQQASDSLLPTAVGLYVNGGGWLGFQAAWTRDGVSSAWSARSARRVR